MQLDRLNEKMLKIPTEEVTVLERGFHLVILRTLKEKNKVQFLLSSSSTITLPTDFDWMQEANQSWVVKFIELFKTNPFGPLVLLLEHHGLLTERFELLLAFYKTKQVSSLHSGFCFYSLLYMFRIREEFRHGEEYWALERKLCCALTSNKKVLIL
ncbi:hypothetical protein CsSME_00006427 [Camellia sinensis var. sinensis]